MRLEVASMMSDGRDEAADDMVLHKVWPCKQQQ